MINNNIQNKISSQSRTIIELITQNCLSILQALSHVSIVFIAVYMFTCLLEK